MDVTIYDTNPDGGKKPFGFRVKPINAREILTHPANKDSKRYVTEADWQEMQAAERLRRHNELAADDDDDGPSEVEVAAKAILEAGNSEDLTQTGKVKKDALVRELGRDVTAAELAHAQSLEV